MARSYRSPTFFGAESNGQSEWKKQARRQFRRLSNIRIEDIGEDGEIEIELPENIREVSDIWSSPSDGIKKYASLESIEKYHVKPFKATRK